MKWLHFCEELFSRFAMLFVYIQFAVLIIKYFFKRVKLKWETNAKIWKYLKDVLAGLVFRMLLWCQVLHYT